MYIIRKTWHNLQKFGTLYIGHTFINDKGNPSMKITPVYKSPTKDSQVYNYYDFETEKFGYATDDDTVIAATFTITENL